MNVERIRRVALWGIPLLVAIALVVLFVPIPPHGRFTFPGIATSGDAYWELANGKVTLVVFTGEETRQFIADYKKVDGRWVATNWVNHRPTELRATLLTLRIIESDGSESGPFYRYEIYKGR
jgi:hypothetical protein